MSSMKSYGLMIHELQEKQRAGVLASNLLATAPPMNPEEPNTVTTSPEKDDRPPRPLFMAAVLSSRGRTSLA